MIAVLPLHQLTACAGLEAALRQVRTHLMLGATAVVLDLTGAPDLGARGMRGLVEILKITTSYQAPLILAGVSAEVDLWLGVTGARQLCTVAADLPAAVRLVSPPAASVAA